MTKLFALLEDGTLHTDDLTKEDAAEMLERHARIFEHIHWEVVPMDQAQHLTKTEGFLERHRRIAVSYFT